jgi:WD40 repeat protein
MKKLKYRFIMLLTCVVVSCQEVTPNMTSTSDESIPPTNGTSDVSTTLPIQGTSTLDTGGENTANQTSANIEFPAELTGRIFVGSSESGKYIKLDFDEKKIVPYNLPRRCQLLSNGQTAICEQASLPIESTPYIYNVPNSQRNFIFSQQGGRWFLTSSDNLLVYATIKEQIISLDAYDLSAKIVFHIGEFDNKEMQLAIPHVSNSGELMIGLNHQSLQWEHDDSWYLMHADTLKDEPLIISETVAATDSIEWSPDDTVVALVGFYQDDEIGHAGTVTCGKEIFFYDPIARTVKTTVMAPANRCITPIGFYPNHIWAPDSSKIAVILDHQDICVADLSENPSDCHIITNYYGTNNYFSGLTWSPDSKYIAFIFEENKMQIYSLENNETYILDANNLSQSFIGGNLVWGQ